MSSTRSDHSPSNYANPSGEGTPAGRDPAARAFHPGPALPGDKASPRTIATGACYACMFNSPQFLFHVCGHCGVVLIDETGRCRLYSFHPIKNEGEPFDEGSIARIVNEEDAANFSAFERACMTPHQEADGREVRGILLDNGHTRWHEEIRRVMKMRVGAEQHERMRAFCERTAKRPPRFNIVTYSCQHFVNDVFAQGGIELRGKHLSQRADIIPNLVYRSTTEKTTNILGFEKIDLVAYEEGLES